MSQLKTSIVLDLTGNIERQAQRFQSGLGRFATRGSASMRLLSGSVAGVGRRLDAVGNKYTGMITGGAGLMAVKQVGDLSAHMTQLGIDGTLSAEGVEALRKKIYEVAQMPDIRINPDELIASVEELVKQTGDLGYAERNLRNFGLSIRGMSASGADVGYLVTELQKLDKAATPEAVLKAIDTFAAQGKAGAVSARDMASVGPRIFSAYRAKRKDADLQTFTTELGAVFQTIKGGKGSVEQAATSFEALVRVFDDPETLKKLKALDIQVFDPKLLREGREELRPLNLLMAEIFEKTKGRGTVLADIFTDSTAREALQVQNLVANLKKYYAVQADGSMISADAKRNADEFNAAMTSIGTSWKKFSYESLKGPIQSLADGLNSLEPGTEERLFKVAGGMAAVGGAAIAIRKGIEYGKFFKDLAAPVKLSGAAGGSAFGSAIPVYVVNGAMSTWDGTPGGGVAGGAGGKAGMLSKAGKVLGTAAAVTGTGLLGYEVGGLINEYGIGGLTSYLTKGKYKGEGALGEMIYDATHRKTTPVEVGGTLKIEITGAAARVKTLERKGGMDLDVDTGLNTVGR